MDPEGVGQGVQTPPPPKKKHKNIGFLSDTGPDPLKITKLPSQHLKLGSYRHVSETQFKWRFNGRPMMAPFSAIWILSPLIKKNHHVRVGPLSGKTFWIHACFL